MWNSTRIAAYSARDESVRIDCTREWTSVPIAGGVLALALLAAAGCDSGDGDASPSGPVMSLSSLSVALSAVEGGADDMVDVTLSNSGGGMLETPTLEGDVESAGWLGTAATSGGAPYTLTLSAAPGSLVPGGYDGTLEVTCEGASNSPQTISVDFTIHARQLEVAFALQSVTEGDGVIAACCTVSIPGALGQDLTVDLASSDASQADVSASAVIAAGETSVAVDVTVIDDDASDGTAEVTVTASASGWASGSSAIDVLDNEGPWADAELVGEGGDVELAVDDAGNVTVVWLSTVPVSNLLPWARRRDSTGVWDDAVALTGDEAVYGGRPQVAAEPAGRVSFTWPNDDAIAPCGERLRATDYDAASGWGTSVAIDNGSAPIALTVSDLAVSADGSAVAVWEMNYGIYANVYAAIGGWSGQAAIDVGDGASSSDPVVAMDGTGGCIAAWWHYVDPRWRITVNRYGSASGWNGTENISAADKHAYYPHVAMNSSGEGILVWQQGDDPSELNFWSIWASRHDPGIGWASPEVLDTGSAGNASTPRATIAPDGNAVVVWTQRGTERWYAWARLYDAQTGWLAPEQIEADDAGSAKEPEVAMDSAGNAIAVWCKWDYATDVSVLWASRYDASAGWSAPVMLQTDFAESVTLGDLSVAMTPDGKAFVAWSETNGSQRNVYLRGLE